MKKIKIKRILNSIKTFLCGDTFKLIIVALSIGITCIACLWAYLMTVFTNDLTNKTISLEEENEYLREELDYYIGESNYYQNYFVELEECLYSCLENKNNE